MLTDGILKRLQHYRAAVSQHGRPFRFIAARLLVKTGLSRHLVIDCGIYRLRFVPSVYTANYWIEPDVRLHPEHAFLLSYLQSGDTVVDVGANQGMMALTAASRVGATGIVYAIEPHPRTFDFLRANVELNSASNVRLFNCAVGNTTAIARISDEPNDSSNFMTDGRGGIEVQVTTLDSLLDDTVSSVALFKIDVEGYEKFVLEGAANILKKTECVYFEAHDPMCARYGYKCVTVLELLRNFGFGMFRWADDHCIVSAPNDYVTQPVPENLLAIRDVEAFVARTGQRYRLCPAGR